jgi:hypothetical protein
MSPQVFSRVHVTRSLALWVCFGDRCLSFCPFPLTLILSVLLRFTDSDYPFSIFKLFKQYWLISLIIRAKTISFLTDLTIYSTYIAMYISWKLWKQRSYSDSHTFHKYQQSEQSPVTFNQYNLGPGFGTDTQMWRGYKI